MDSAAMPMRSIAHRVGGGLVLPIAAWMLAIGWLAWRRGAMPAMTSAGGMEPSRLPVQGS